MERLWEKRLRFLEKIELGKLHFITLNYVLNYILHLKLLEYTLYTLNYETYYILHPNINFIIKLDGK